MKTQKSSRVDLLTKEVAILKDMVNVLGYRLWMLEQKTKEADGSADVLDGVENREQEGTGKDVQHEDQD